MDDGQIQQVVTNLVVNAIQAMPAGGEIDDRRRRASARARPTELGGAAGDYVRLRVRDEGAGIAAETLPHVFEPFFTTKDVGEGTGLGLSVTYGIVQRARRLDRGRERGRQGQPRSRSTCRAERARDERTQSSSSTTTSAMCEMLDAGLGQARLRGRLAHLGATRRSRARRRGLRRRRHRPQHARA